jgi:hypothetical protein
MEMEVPDSAEHARLELENSSASDCESLPSHNEHSSPASSIKLLSPDECLLCLSSSSMPSSSPFWMNLVDGFHPLIPLPCPPLLLPTRGCLLHVGRWALHLYSSFLAALWELDFLFDRFQFLQVSEVCLCRLGWIVVAFNW